MQKRLRAVEVPRELAHRLGHHPCLRADGLVAHLPLKLHARRERGDGVDRDDVDRTGAHEHVGDLQRLLPVVGLGDEQLVDVDADLLGVERVHRVLGVDERAHAPQLLGLGEHVVDQRGLTGGLGTEDLDDAPARHPADAEREVERQRPGGDRGDTHLRTLVAHAHDAALAELALDLSKRPLQRGVASLGGLLLLVYGHGLLLRYRDWSAYRRRGVGRNTCSITAEARSARAPRSWPPWVRATSGKARAQPARTGAVASAAGRARAGHLRSACARP